MPRLCLVACVLGAVALVSCDGTDEPRGGPALPDAVMEQADDLRACLADAGLQPVRSDTGPEELEDPFVKLDVELDSEKFSRDYLSEVYVFESETSATRARSLIAPQSDDERGVLLGNVFVTFTIVPDKEDAATVNQCAADVT